MSGSTFLKLLENLDLWKAEMGQLKQIYAPGLSYVPLLFSFASKTLAIAMRKSAEITVVEIWTAEPHLCPFVDDIVLFLTNLETSIKALNHLLKTFGEFSGYKTNTIKSTLLVLNKEEREHPLIQTLLFNASTRFTYLGIKITPVIKNTTATNCNSFELERCTETVRRLD